VRPPLRGFLTLSSGFFDILCLASPRRKEEMKRSAPGVLRILEPRCFTPPIFQILDQLNGDQLNRRREPRAQNKVSHIRDLAFHRYFGAIIFHALAPQRPVHFVQSVIIHKPISTRRPLEHCIFERLSLQLGAEVATFLRKAPGPETQDTLYNSMVIETVFSLFFLGRRSQ
jgi:hypothetical protein